MASIVVIDRDRDLLTTLCDVLEYDGHDVVGFASASEALGHLRTSGSPSLILLNIETPVVCGTRFRNEQLRDPKLAAIPVVAMTNGSDFDIGPLAVTEVLAKPIQLLDLLMAVARLSDSDVL